MEGLGTVGAWPSIFELFLWFHFAVRKKKFNFPALFNSWLFVNKVCWNAVLNFPALFNSWLLVNKVCWNAVLNFPALFNSWLLVNKVCWNAEINYQFDSGWSGCPWWSSSTRTGMWMKHFSRRQCWRFQSWRCRWWCSSGDGSWGWVAFGTTTAFCAWVVQLQMRGAFFGLSIVASSSTIGFEWYSWKETMINYVLCASCLEFMYILWVCIWRQKYSTNTGVVLDF